VVDGAPENPTGAKPPKKA